jgi:hypothetical protein
MQKIIKIALLALTFSSNQALADNHDHSKTWTAEEVKTLHKTINNCFDATISKMGKDDKVSKDQAKELKVCLKKTLPQDLDN